MRWAWWDWGLSGWLTTLLQCFDTVGWVIRPVKHRLWNDLNCVEWDIKPCCTQPNTNWSQTTIAFCLVNVLSRPTHSAVYRLQQIVSPLRPLVCGTVSIACLRCLISLHLSFSSYILYLLFSLFYPSFWLYLFSLVHCPRSDLSYDGYYIYNCLSSVVLECGLVILIRSKSTKPSTLCRRLSKTKCRLTATIGRCWSLSMIWSTLLDYLFTCCAPLPRRLLAPYMSVRLSFSCLWIFWEKRMP